MISDSSSITVPEHILAFRTISSLLSKIQQSDASPTIDDLVEKGSYEHQELKILSALASALVMDHEVVAVASKHVSGEEGGLEVIINTHTNESLLNSPQPSTLQNIVRYLFGKNPRRENTTTTTGPVLMEPTAPLNFESVEKWINEFW